MSSYSKFLRRVRIHGRECGAVARALRHKIEANPLSAVDKKVLSTTNERKVMSKTTFFKRIALTAIAALGFGMLSVAPSQAAAGTPVLTATNGTASATLGAAETSTAASVSITGLTTTANDSYTVSVFRKSAPDSALVDGSFHVVYLDTVTYSATRVDTDAQQAAFATTANAVDTVNYDSRAVGTANVYHFDAGGAAGYAGAKFGIMVDSGTNRVGSEGAYVFTVTVTPVSAGTAGTSVSTDVTLTINQTAAGAAAAVTTVDPSKTKAVLNAGAGTDTTTADATVAVVATSATTTHATIQVNTYNVGGYAAAESITVTLTGPGLVGTSAGVYGKSLTLTGAGGATSILVRADGTAGTASIVVATTTVTFPAKSVTFYAVAPSTVVASVNKPVISVGTNSDVVRATFKDANGNIWGGAAYIYASTAADALIAGSLTTPVACSFDATDQRHECDISGAIKGTASFKVIDAAGAATTAATAVANATVTSDALSVRVSTGVASSVVLSFDKATYAPGEKAQLRVSVLDGEGLSMPGVTITNGLAAGGITTSSALGANSDTTTAVSFDLSGSTSAAANVNAGHKTYVVYMPATAGAVTVSATGGTGIAAAGRVALTATATVVDTSNDAAIDAAEEAIDAANAATDAANLAAEAADAATVAAEEARDAADAATAAVEALSTEVATLMAALKAQITTLANVVAKIAKRTKS